MKKVFFIILVFLLALVIESIILKLYLGVFLDYRIIELIIHFSSIKLVGSFIISLIISFIILSFKNKIIYTLAIAIVGVFIVFNFSLIKIIYQINTLNPATNIDKQFFTCDKKHFIAHAGGEIETYVYTDSLEALNNSYKKGFKFFELDIRKTKDSKFVAVHDWDEWKKENGFKRIPTLKEFLSYKIYKKYTPLDLDRINKWFSEHKDAILVTDKINNPQFANLFVDKKRIMMELFSLDAFIKSKQMNIIGMPNWGVIEYIDYKKLPNFIKYMTIASGDYYKNLEKMKFLSSHGVKIYIFGDYNKDIKPYYYYGRYVDNLGFCK